jgi:hypothetical protein
MNLQQQLGQLERRRDIELRTVTFEFARLKSNLRQALSPRRAIRKHPVAALMGAAALGLLLAPGRRRATASTHNGHSSESSILTRVLRLAARHSPDLRDLLNLGPDGTPLAHGGSASPPPPPASARYPAAGPPDEPLANFLVGTVVPFLQRLDWQAILAAWIVGMKAHRSHYSPKARRSPRPAAAAAAAEGLAVEEEGYSDSPPTNRVTQPSEDSEPT